MPLARGWRRNAVEWSGLVPSRGRELTWRSLIFGRGELLDELDYGSPKLWVRDFHERLGELVSIGGGEIVCYILRIGSVDWYTALSGFLREPLEEGFHGHLQYLRNLLQAARANALGLTFQQVQKYEKGANRMAASRTSEALLLDGMAANNAAEPKGGLAVQ